MCGDDESGCMMQCEAGEQAGSSAPSKRNPFNRIVLAPTAPESHLDAFLGTATQRDCRSLSSTLCQCHIAPIWRWSKGTRFNVIISFSSVKFRPAERFETNLAHFHNERASNNGSLMDPLLCRRFCCLRRSQILRLLSVEPPDAWAAFECD